MKAKEMFEKIGFKKVERYDDKISYERENPRGDIEAIDFPLNQFSPQRFATFLNGQFSDVSIEELPAINKQVEELGWEVNK